MSLVGGVLAEIESIGSEIISDKGPDVITGLVADGRARKGDVVALVSAELPGSETITEGAVDDVLNLVDANAGLFVGLTAITFTQIVGHFHEDEVEKAKNVHVAREATYDEANAWIASGGDAAQTEREARDKLWAEAEAFLKSLGKVALKILVAVGKLLIFPV